MSEKLLSEFELRMALAQIKYNAKKEYNRQYYLSKKDYYSRKKMNQKLNPLNAKQ